MAELRPKGMTTEQFSGMMRKHGFPACSRAAISLAERPNESGVQFTQRFRNAAQDLLNAPRRKENRKNGNKTTVWLDDELREWVETRAYMEEIPVGEFIRVVLREYKFLYELKKSSERTYRRLVLPFIERQKEAASGAATSEAAGAPETSGRQSAVPTGHLHDTTKQEENQG